MNIKTVKIKNFTQLKKIPKFFFHEYILIFIKNGPKKIKTGLTPVAAF